MRLSRAVMAWLLLVLLTACVSSHTGEYQTGPVRPAVDSLLTRGYIQVAKMHLRTSDLTQVRSMGSIQPRRKPPYGPSRPHMGSRCRDCSIARRVRY